MTHPNDIPKGRALEFVIRFRKPEYLNESKFLWIAYLGDEHFTDQATGGTPEEALTKLIRKHGWFQMGESVQ